MRPAAMTDDEYFERNYPQPMDAIEDFERTAEMGPPSRGSEPKYLDRALTPAERQRLRRARKRGEVPIFDPPLPLSQVLARIRTLGLGEKVMRRIEGVLR